MISLIDTWLYEGLVFFDEDTLFHYIAVEQELQDAGRRIEEEAVYCEVQEENIDLFLEMTNMEVYYG